MKNFITPISMKCTQKQYEEQLRDELLKMGYKESCLIFPPKANYITNNFGGRQGTISNLIQNEVKNYGRTYLDSFNPELFLALAAMTDSAEGNYGEYWVAKENFYEDFKKGQLYKQIKKLNEYGAFIGNNGELSGNCPNNLTSFRKATKEEIVNKFQSEKELIPEKGEYYYCKCKGSGNEYVFISNGANYYKTNKIVSFCIRSKKLDLDNNLGITFDDDIEILRLANSEERQLLDSELAKLDRYFDKETMSIKEIKKENMKTFTTTRAKMGKIHDVACVEWTPIIITLTEKYATSTFSELVVLPEFEVSNMFNAATPTQLPVLKDIFPEYNPDKNIFCENPTYNQISECNKALASIAEKSLKLCEVAYENLNRPDLKNRSLFVDNTIKVIVHTLDSGASVIEFVKK